MGGAGKPSGPIISIYFSIGGKLLDFLLFFSCFMDGNILYGGTTIVDLYNSLEDLNRNKE